MWSTPGRQLGDRTGARTATVRVERSAPASSGSGRMRDPQSVRVVSWSCDVFHHDHAIHRRHGREHKITIARKRKAEESLRWREVEVTPDEEDRDAIMQCIGHTDERVTGVKRL